ncbi:MAG TPA: hypothetical protein VMM80_12990 [Bacteroidota bacterium]|nr:hypothetical protein [Bacteroidota bacterium]
MTSRDAAQTLSRIRTAGLVAALAGVAAFAPGAIAEPSRALQSYLFGYMFWLNFTMGCIGVLMLHHMVSGGWGFMIQRSMEAGAWTILPMAVLFVPLLMSVRTLYPWAGGSAAHVWGAWLNVRFFSLRVMFYFAVWIAAALLLGGWSRRQDAGEGARFTRRLRLLSAAGLPVYVFTMTFASIDWVMSLEPGWYSTIYGAIFVVDQVLGALALAAIVLRFVPVARPLRGVVTTRRVHHLGNMMLTFVILWAYVAYSQYIIIWSGDLPDENSWYLRRSAGGWGALALVLIVVHFALPLLLLLFRSSKRSLRALARIALLLLVMRFADTFWLVIPAFGGAHPGLILTDIAAPLGIGGLWVAAFAWRLKGGSLVPMCDPRFPPLLETGEGT